MKTIQQITLETAISQAIREYERSCPETVIGVAITRINQKFLEVNAMTIPGASTSGKRKSKVSIGSLEVTSSK